MTAKRFLAYRLISVMILAGVISASVSIGNYFMPIVAIITFLAVFSAMRKKVKEVIADERDYELAGKASRYSVMIFGIASSIIVLVLFAFKDRDPLYEVIGITLAYSVCALLLVSSILYKYFQNHEK